MRLLQQNNQESDQYAVRYEGKFYMLSRPYLSDELWEIMRRCAAFEQTYKAYRQENLDKKWMIFPKQERIWREMIDDYNRQCH